MPTNSLETIPAPSGVNPSSITMQGKASSEMDLRIWTKTDQKLYDTLEKCRQKFAQREKPQTTDSSTNFTNGTVTGLMERSNTLSLISKSGTTIKASPRCPQFAVVSDGDDHLKRKRHKVIKKSRSLLDVTKDLDHETEEVDKEIILKLPIQVKSVKVHNHPRKENVPHYGSNLLDVETHRKARAGQGEINSQPPPPTPITIPTGASLKKTKNTESEMPGPSFCELPVAKRGPKRKVIRVAASVSDVSPSVSSTSHVLLQKNISKVTYSFPAVTLASREPVHSSNTRNGSLQESPNSLRSLSQTPGSIRDSPRISLPRIPKYSSPYHWKAYHPDQLNDQNSRSDVMSSLSMKTPPTVSLPDSPDGEQHYIQTADGVFVLNIVRSLTINSMSSISSSPLYMFRHRDRMSLPSSQL